MLRLLVVVLVMVFVRSAVKDGSMGGHVSAKMFVVVFGNVMRVESRRVWAKYEALSSIPSGGGFQGSASS